MLADAASHVLDSVKMSGPAVSSKSQAAAFADPGRNPCNGPPWRPWPSCRRTGNGAPAPPLVALLVTY